MAELKTKGCLPWIGGKSLLAKWIISFFPEHTCYVEPFGGAANVLLQKEPSKVEVYNDINGHVVEFFEVLQGKPWELIGALLCLPKSRQMYEDCVKKAKAGKLPKEKVKRVAMWFYLQKYSFSGHYLSGWSHSVSSRRSAVSSSLVNSLVEVSNRFMNVQIEHSDFRKIIKTYDSPESLFYVDSPYFGKERYYLGNFSAQDHADLAQLLNGIQGKAIVSYYPNEKLASYYPGWASVSRFVSCSSFGLTNFSGKKTVRPKREEMLLFNFKVKKEND